MRAFLVGAVFGLVILIVGMASLLVEQFIERRKLAPVSEPTQQQVTEYIESHNGSAPAAEWYPNGDPWRNFTAEEANEMLEGFENP